MGAPNELSFLPDDYLERKARRRTNAICAILFCVVIGAIGAAFTVTERSMKEIDAQFAAVQQQYTDAAKRIEQVQQMQEKQRTMAHQAELTASLLEKVPRSFILAELTNGMPSGVSLLDFNLDARLLTGPPPPPKTQFEIRKAEVSGVAPGTGVPTSSQPRSYEVTMRATGVAMDDVQVSQFITKMNQSRFLRDVNLLYTDEFTPGQKDGDKLRKFQIEMSLDPHAVVDAETAQNQMKSASTALPVETK